MIYLAVVCVFLLFLAPLALGYWISNILMYPPRQDLFATPEDYGLAFEDVVFKSQDGLSLKGWWIPAPDVATGQASGPAVILLHPMFGNRQGIAARRQGRPRLLDEDVELLKVAGGFHYAGFAVLMFDFRGHGTSQAGRCAGGLTEDQDVRGAVDYVFKRMAADVRAKEMPQVGVVGFGLGASAAIAAVGREKGGAEVIRVFSGDSEGAAGLVEIQPSNVKKLRFLVAIQPASLSALLRGYIGEAFGPLSAVLVYVTNRLCVWRGGYPLDEAFLLKYARQVNVPVLYVQSSQDPWGGAQEVQKLFQATTSAKKIWWIEGALRRQDTYSYVSDHPEDMLDFAAHYIDLPGGAE